MQVIDIEQNSEEWFEFRRGKIGSSKLKDIVVLRGTSKKDGFYQLLADRLAINTETEEDARGRGHRLEEEAAQEFEKDTGLVTVKNGAWVSDFNPNVYISPDRAIKDDLTQAVEIKCFEDKHHIRAYLEDGVPKKLYFQILQYFIVNDQLEKLHVVFYTDRIPSMKYKRLEVTREEVEKDVEKYKQYQIDTLAEIDEIVEKYAF